VDDPLHIEGALQGCFRFGIKVLASAVGAAPSPQSGIVRFIMIGAKSHQLRHLNRTNFGT
jgi:hypothetical protein